MRKQPRKKSSKFIENLEKDSLLFVFSDACIDVDVNPDVYSKKDKDEIYRLANELANKIYIDKSYVEFSENKHQDTFMYEDGWKQLCNLVLDTHFGNKATKDQNEQLQDAYQTIICIYVSNCLKLFGYDDEHFDVQIAENSTYRVEVYYDMVQDWKYYPGPWQDWIK